MDSWLVVDGATAGLDLHRQRFAGAVRTVFDRQLPPEFWEGVEQACRAPGRWFPRVEAGPDGFVLRLRPAPRLRTTTRLWVPPVADPRATPTVKGPDMAVLQALRSRAVTAGADDAVLHSGGQVREAANAALLFFDRGTPVVPAGPRLDSVTLRLVLEALAECGAAAPETRPVSVAAAPGLACWSLSALHGVTEVTGWCTAGAAGDPADETVAFEDCPRRDPAAVRARLARRWGLPPEN